MTEEQVVAFKLGTENFAIPIGYIKEIIRPTSITVVPQAKGYVRGILNLRGNVVTVINLAKQLGYSAETRDNDQKRIIILEYKDTVLGFEVDAVNEVLRINADSIEPPPVSVQDEKYLMGVGKVNDQLLLMLNVSALFIK